MKLSDRARAASTRYGHCVARKAIAVRRRDYEYQLAADSFCDYLPKGGHEWVTKWAIYRPDGTGSLLVGYCSDGPSIPGPKRFLHYCWNIGAAHWHDLGYQLLREGCFGAPESEEWHAARKAWDDLFLRMMYEDIEALMARRLLKKSQEKPARWRNPKLRTLRNKTVAQRVAAERSSLRWLARRMHGAVRRWAEFAAKADPKNREIIYSP